VIILLLGLSFLSCTPLIEVPEKEGIIYNDSEILEPCMEVPEA